MEAEKPVIISKAPIGGSTVIPILMCLGGCFGIYRSLYDSGVLPYALIAFLLAAATFFGSRGNSIEVYKDKLKIKLLFRSPVTVLFDNITSWEEMPGWGSGYRTILYTKNMPLESYSIGSRDYDNYQELKALLTKNKPIEPQED